MPLLTLSSSPLKVCCSTLSTGISSNATATHMRAVGRQPLGWMERPLCQQENGDGIQCMETPETAYMRPPASFLAARTTRLCRYGPLMERLTLPNRHSIRHDWSCEWSRIGRHHPDSEVRRLTCDQDRAIEASASLLRACQSQHTSTRTQLRIDDGGCAGRDSRSQAALCHCSAYRRRSRRHFSNVLASSDSSKIFQFILLDLAFLNRRWSAHRPGRHPVRDCDPPRLHGNSGRCRRVH
ncbi:hypothetical protein V8E36_008047 [Tilletia maclaganii]